MMATRQSYASEARPGVKRRRPWQSAAFRKQVVAWLFILPITLFHLVVVVIPVFSAVYYSLTEWSGIGPAEFIGLENYQELFFEDDNFQIAFGNNLKFMAYYLTIPFGVALFIASLLMRVRRGAQFFRTVLFLPNMLPTVAFYFIWQQILSPLYGVGAQLKLWGIPGFDIPLLGRTDTALATVALIGIWGYWGFLMVMFLTAMQAVPTDLYDAVKIDGANRWQEFLHVTLPGIRATVLFMLMNVAATIFAAFNGVYILTLGGPARSSELVATYLYERAFGMRDMGYAAAIGVTVALLAAVILGLFGILRRRGWEV